MLTPFKNNDKVRFSNSYNLLFLGPLVSVLLKRYSIRQVVIAGTVLSTAGFLTSVFGASNVYILILTYGIISGEFITFLNSSSNRFRDGFFCLEL